jgi:hypothetical protein
LRLHELGCEQGAGTVRGGHLDQAPLQQATCEPHCHQLGREFRHQADCLDRGLAAERQDAAPVQLQEYLMQHDAAFPTDALGGGGEFGVDADVMLVFK